MKIKDKVNYWTVISTDAPPEHRYHVLCRCICGEEKWVNCSALRLGKSKSCGCKKRYNRKEYDLQPGDKVGYWTIINNDGDRFRCRCICGAERVIKHNILKNGRSLSCGCRRSDHQVKKQKANPSRNIWKIRECSKSKKKRRGAILFRATKTGE